MVEGMTAAVLPLPGISASRGKLSIYFIWSSRFHSVFHIWIRTSQIRHLLLPSLINTLVLNSDGLMGSPFSWTCLLFDIFLYQTFGKSVKTFQNGQSAQPCGLPLMLCLHAFSVGVQVHQSYPIHLSWCQISRPSANVHWTSKVYQALSHDIGTLYLLHFCSNIMLDGGWNLISLFGTKI